MGNCLSSSSSVGVSDALLRFEGRNLGSARRQSARIVNAIDAAVVVGMPEEAAAFLFFSSRPRTSTSTASTQPPKKKKKTQPSASKRGSAVASKNSGFPSSASSSGASPPFEDFLVLSDESPPPPPVTDLFTLGRVLGRGAFGVTRLAKERATGASAAVKTIARRRIAASMPDHADRVRCEVEAMRRVAGHPHIVSLKSAHEDANGVHLAMVRIYFYVLFSLSFYFSRYRVCF